MFRGAPFYLAAEASGETRRDTKGRRLISDVVQFAKKVLTRNVWFGDWENLWDRSVALRAGCGGGNLQMVCGCLETLDAFVEGLGDPLAVFGVTQFLFVCRAADE